MEKYPIFDQINFEDAQILLGEDRAPYITDEQDDALIVTVDATHLGYVNKNGYFYTPNSAKSAKNTWTKPYNKPVLGIKDSHMLINGEPIGIVIDSKYAEIPQKTKKSPNSKLILTLKILDPDAKAKIKDGRYNTVSVGSYPKKIVCSICGEDITDSPYTHEHTRGEVYDGKTAYWIIDVDEYREVSFVNLPADADADHAAGVTQINDAEEEEQDMEDKMEQYFEDNYEIVLQKVCKDLEIDFEDAKLTAAKRKKLSSSEFCGPNKSFPVPDKAHVLAAIRLLNRYKGPGDKNKIRACIKRRAKSLGMDTSKWGDSYDDAEKSILNDYIEGVDMELKDQIKSLEDQLIEKDNTIKTLQDKVESLSTKIKDFEDKEKDALAHNILNAKKERHAADVEVDDFNEDNFIKDLTDKDVNVLKAIYDSIITIPVNEPENTNGADLNDAAEDAEGNINDASDDKNEKEDVSDEEDEL